MTMVKGYRGSVSFDGQVVRIEKPLRGEAAIPLSAITSVGIFNAGIGMRAIRFSVAGGSVSAPTVALGSHKVFAADPYAVTFRKKYLGEFQAFMSLVESGRLA